MKQDARRSLSARVNALVEANANGGRLCEYYVCVHVW